MSMRESGRGRSHIPCTRAGRASCANEVLRPLCESPGLTDECAADGGTDRDKEDGQDRGMSIGWKVTPEG